MSNWRDPILREFTAKVARLIMIADADGLLLEEGILVDIRKRGSELIPFEDHLPSVSTVSYGEPKACLSDRHLRRQVSRDLD